MTESTLCGRTSRLVPRPHDARSQRGTHTMLSQEAGPTHEQRTNHMNRQLRERMSTPTGSAITATTLQCCLFFHQRWACSGRGRALRSSLQSTRTRQHECRCRRTPASAVAGGVDLLKRTEVVVRVGMLVVTGVVRASPRLLLSSQGTSCALCHDALCQVIHSPAGEPTISTSHITVPGVEPVT